MDDEELLLENLTPANIFQIAWEISEQTHDPIDAKRLLYKYCDLFKKKEPIPFELFQHFNDAFIKYLSGDTDLDTAFGLTPGKKRSGINKQMGFDIAVDLLKERIKGNSNQVALKTLAKTYGWSERTIGDIWKKNKLEAVIILRLQKGLEGIDLTEEEMNNIIKLFV